MKNEIGVIQGLSKEGPRFEKVIRFGLKVCQLVSWDQSLWTDEMAAQIKKESLDSGMRMTSFWAGWPGPKVWDFIKGPDTLGIVPKSYRAERVETLKKAGGFAKKVGVPAVITHLGFIPENAGDPLFLEVVEAVREIALHLKEHGLEFWFESGQETPVTLLRLIEQVGTGNLGINLDPANLILYGKANPIDALDVFGKHVKNIHAKDGMYPVDPMKLGKEVKVGTGQVRFPEFAKRLKEIGFVGEWIIEREISGEEKNRDIAETVKYLSSLLKEI